MYLGVRTRLKGPTRLAIAVASLVSVQDSVTAVIVLRGLLLMIISTPSHSSACNLPIPGAGSTLIIERQDIRYSGIRGAKPTGYYLLPSDPSAIWRGGSRCQLAAHGAVGAVLDLPAQIRDRSLAGGGQAPLPATPRRCR